MSEQDSMELEDLFDSIAAENTAAPSAVITDNVDAKPDTVINQIGHLTRALHDSLRDLGYDKNLEKAASTIPDARDRLSYVATLTQKAAEKVLNAVDEVQPMVHKLDELSTHMAVEWKSLLDGQMNVNQFKHLATQTHTFFSQSSQQYKSINDNLMNIVMAQDFQDLTGQVIKKIIEVTQQMEKQLVVLLVQNPPSTANPDAYAGLLNGPVISAKGRTDVVANQDQVDDLLASLGF